jgi:transposase
MTLVARRSTAAAGGLPPAAPFHTATASDRGCSGCARLYRDRNTVERAINRMKDWRGVATRYDKKPESYLAGLHLRAATIWINSLLKTTDRN